MNYEEVTSQAKFFDNYQNKITDLQAFMQKWEGIHLEIEQFVD